MVVSYGGWPEGRPVIYDVSPPVLNLRAVSLIPLFHISSFVLLPALSVCLTLLCFWPILLTFFPLNYTMKVFIIIIIIINCHFQKGRLFCVVLVFFLLLIG